MQQVCRTTISNVSIKEDVSHFKFGKIHLATQLLEVSNHLSTQADTISHNLSYGTVVGAQRWCAGSKDYSPTRHQLAACYSDTLGSPTG